MSRLFRSTLAVSLLAFPTGVWAQNQPTPPSESTPTPRPSTEAPAEAPRANAPAPEAPRPSSTEAAAAPAARTDGQSADPSLTGTSLARPTPPPSDLLDRIGQSVVLHGNFRVRPELMNDFSLGWDNPALGVGLRYGNLPWTRPIRTEDLLGLCNAQSLGGGDRPAIDCSSATQSMANLRLRLNPEIHITDGISLHTQIDILDNLVMGSTPQGYFSGNAVGSPWAPLTAFSQTQVTPTPSNSLVPSISVSRAWAEVTNPTLGQIRFGRMPSQWGLGILANAGNGIDSDFQSHVDRLMYAARIRSLRLFIAGFYDFASSGATTQNLRYEAGQGQPIDVTDRDDVNQYGIAVGRRYDAGEARQRIARGETIVNAGFYGLYRTQELSGEFGCTGGSTTTTGDSGDPAANDGRDQRTCGNATRDYANAFVRRDAWAVVADGWFQVLNRNFRLELEVAGIFGSMNTQPGASGAPRYLDIRQFGGAAEFEYRLLNNRLQLEFRTGFASGDSDLEGLNFHSTALAPQRGAATSNTLFRFHPDYRVDMILWRQVMRQVSGAYYFRPGVMYAFVNSPRGDRFYGRASAIYSRASSFVQTRGNDPDLGIELNAEVTYVSNHRSTTLGEPPAPGFFASLQYGVLFPMAGLGPRTDERAAGAELAAFDFKTAQTLRAVLGVQF